MSLRNALYWFGQHSYGRVGSGPRKGAILLDDGTLVHVDYTNYADRAKASATFDHYVGHVCLVPKPNKWGGEARHPVQPSWTVRTTNDYDTAEEAAAALYAAVAEAKAKEEAVQADPAAWLDRELSHHDWFAAYSDAPGVCGAADMHWKLIEDLRKRVSPEVWAALFDKHAPAECKGQSA